MHVNEHLVTVKIIPTPVPFPTCVSPLEPLVSSPLATALNLAALEDPLAGPEGILPRGTMVMLSSLLLG